MENILLNNELNLSYPEGFHVLDDEERNRLTFFEDGPGVCLSDPERHIMMSVGWKQAGGFAAMVLNSKDVAKNMEAKIRKPMKQFGYRLEGFVSREVGGKQANGFRYEYEAQGIGMFAESLAVKMNKTIYYIHFYARTALKAESLPIMEDILGSILWM